MSKSVVILAGARTAVGTFGGALAGIPPTDLAIQVAVEAIRRAKVDAADIGTTVMGNVIHTEPKDMYLSRVTAIGAGIPDTSPALTVNRLCGSGLQAVVSGYESILLGNADMALTGGAESMSRTGHLMTASRFGQKMGDVQSTDMMIGALNDPLGNGHMGITAENVATRHGISRDQQDVFALQSHQRAAHAQKQGYFDSQILPVAVKHRRETMAFDKDENIRPNATREDLAKLRPAFRKDGLVTAGNASGLNDGAGALVLADEDVASKQGLTPMARIVATGLGGVAPEVMGLGPIPATHQALSRAGLTVADLDVIESNEAFAAQACAVSQDLGFDPARVNPNGGAIALGHPIGASGAVILIKLLYELQRTDGRFGLATMCIGGGQGISAIVENLG